MMPPVMSTKGACARMETSPTKTMNTKERFEQLKELELNARSTLHKAKSLKIKEQMHEMSEIVSMSYIAKTYFNKTKSWLSQ
jgi:hypothetical protein